MNPNVNVRPFAYRILRRLKRFTVAEAMNKAAYADLPITEGEQLLGRYSVQGEPPTQDIIFTTYNVYLFSDRWRSIPYTTIVKAHVPLEEGQTKITADTLLILTVDGEQHRVLVRGGDANTRDVWEVLRFFNRVIASISRSASSSSNSIPSPTSL